MITVSKQPTLNIVLFAVIGVLLIVLYFSACNKPVPSPNTTHADSTTAKARADVKAALDKADSVAKIATHWKNKYDSLWSANLGNVRRINLQAQKISALLDSNKYFKQKNDTLSQLVTCDEIASQVDMLLELLHASQTNVDSLHSAADSLSAIQQREILDLKIALRNLESQLLSLKADYDALVKSNKKTINRLKLEDIVAKIALITAGILAAVAISK